MTSGGTRARSGPPPNPNSLRQADKDWIALPPEGRTGEAPEWPLDGRTKREADLWVAEWARPQAVMWERNGAELEVALYVRRLAEAEKPGAATNLATLVKQMMEGLGISQDGLAKRHWTIAEDEVGARREATQPASSAKARLQALNG